MSAWYFFLYIPQLPSQRWKVGSLAKPQTAWWITMEEPWGFSSPSEGLKWSWAMKKTPGYLLYIGDCKLYYPIIWGFFHKPWNKDTVPIKQPGFSSWKVRGCQGSIFFPWLGSWENCQLRGFQGFWDPKVENFQLTEAPWGLFFFGCFFGCPGDGGMFFFGMLVGFQE